MSKALTIRDAFVKKRQSLENLLAVRHDAAGRKRWLEAAFQLSQKPELRKATPESVLAVCMDVASMGLDISPTAREAAVVVFGDKATLVLEYRGCVKLVDERYPGVEVHSDVVRAGDKFRVVGGSENARIEHEPDVANTNRSQEPLTWAYSVVKLPGGQRFLSYMDRGEIHGVRAKSRSYQRNPRSSPWGDPATEPEMWKKTTLKRACKPIPLGPRVMRAFKQDDENEFGEREPEFEVKASPAGDAAADDALNKAEESLGLGPFAEPGEDPEPFRLDPEFDNNPRNACAECGAKPSEGHNDGCSLDIPF